MTQGRQSQQAQEATRNRVRPEPPDFLTAEQAAIWRRVVADIPPDWFASPVQLTMVTQLVRHIALADKAAAAVEAATSADSVEGWAKVQRAETAAILSLMRSMRLTQQSTVSKAKKLSAPRGPLPHESVPDAE